ncbi:MAG: hypothetical protein HY040_08450 [Planctomycetes bacterium]|nr:hypothetical protein [Planctomycetota bacterium]
MARALWKWVIVSHFDRSATAMRQISAGLAILFIGSMILAQDDGDKIASGLGVGKILPGSFDSLIINGKYKGRQHCLVCEHGLNPAVAVFAREPGEGKDGPLNALLSKLDEVVERHPDESLGAFAIILSPDAKSSANNPDETDAAKLVEEARARDELVKRHSARTEKLKSLVVGCLLPEGPKGYNINPKAEVTVLLYERHKVVANFAFAPGKMSDADVGRIVAAVEKMATGSAAK